MMKILIPLMLSFSVYAKVQIKWLGVAGFHITDGKTDILIDPVFNRPSFWKILFARPIPPDGKLVEDALKRFGITKVDGIFISHTHHDHSLDAPLIIKQVGGKLYGSSSTLMVGRGHHLNESYLQEIKFGDTQSVGDFKISSYNGPHAPVLFEWYFAEGKIEKPLDIQKSSPWDYKMGESFSFLVAHPQGKIYFQLTAKNPLEKEVEGVKVDVLVQSIAVRPSTEFLVETRMKTLEPKLVIPSHHDNFFDPLPAEGEEVSLLPLVRLEEFVTTTQKLYPQGKVMVPELGKVIEI